MHFPTTLLNYNKTIFIKKSHKQLSLYSMLPACQTVISQYFSSSSQPTETLLNPLLTDSVSLPLHLIKNEWNCQETTGPAVVNRFPDFSTKYPAGSHPDEILSLCRDRAINNPFAFFTDVLDDILPVDIVFQFLIFWKSQLGLSCSGAIVATGILFRTILLPITLFVEQERRNNYKYRPGLEELESYRKTNSGKDSSRLSVFDMKHLLTEYKKQHNVSLFPKAYIVQGLIQLPILATFWRCIHIISRHPEDFREFTMEAPLWLSSLAMPDPLYLVPIIFASLLALNAELIYSTRQNIELRGLIGKRRTFREIHNICIRLSLNYCACEIAKKHSKYIDQAMQWRRLSRISSILSVLMLGRLPVGLLLYMSINMLYQVIMAFLFRIPSVEQYLGFHPSGIFSESDVRKIIYPFRQITQTINASLNRLKLKQIHF